ERLSALHGAEEKYAHRVMQQGLVEENDVQLAKVRKDLAEAEREQSLVEAEARQVQQEVDTLEKRLREFSVGRKFEEWQRFKELSDGLAEAEQQVMAAHQHQGQLTKAALEGRRAANRWLFATIGGGALGVILGIVALFMLSQQAVLASILGLIALALLAGAGS